MSSFKILKKSEDFLVFSPESKTTKEIKVLNPFNLPKGVSIPDACAFFWRKGYNEGYSNAKRDSDCSTK